MSHGFVILINGVTKTYKTIKNLVYLFFYLDECFGVI